MYEEGRCVYLEACSFDFAKKAVRGMEKRGKLGLAAFDARPVGYSAEKRRGLGPWRTSRLECQRVLAGMHRKGSPVEQQECITVKGRTVHITVEKMQELLALLESIKESPALPQGKALSNSSEVSCGGVEERQQPAQRGLFTQLRDMTLVKPLGRLNGTSRM
ncbi:hypothetical protein FOZ62_027189 [Perkinsus olseni]|uniref:Uncharacterized protein n=1 Tax=Perkinsus olseni TaxID=32597 RepID=A0A7J6QHB7_PEROL|nr:hypothetical protein FOZ62_027189 [Perkinsus olseni]